MLHQSPAPWHRMASHCPGPHGANLYPLNPKQSYASRRSQHSVERQHSGVNMGQTFPMSWLAQWQVPGQWPFWTLWAFLLAQGSYSRRSLYDAFENRASPPPVSPSTAAWHRARGASTARSSWGRKTGTVPHACQSIILLVSDEVVIGTSAAQVLDDSRAHQELLKRVEQNLQLQIELVSESPVLIMDILAPAGPTGVVLPLIKTIQETMKTLC